MKYLLAVLSVVVSFAMVTFAYLGGSGKPHIEALSAEHNRLHEKTEALRKENERLKSQIEAFKSDDIAIERAAREQLGMVKENEIIIQFDH
ncbi:MAG: hypothetical protein Kow0090_09630 [Myxococcota bacterium]